MATALNLNLVALALQFVRLRPKTSAAIAFELGILAAQAVTRARNRRSTTGSSRFIAIAPSLADFADYLPGQTKPSAPKPRRKAATGVKRAPRVKKAPRNGLSSS
jgi:hypothetical protein